MRSFTCATFGSYRLTHDDDFDGPRRWILVRVHDDLDQLVAAARSLQPDQRFDDRTRGCFQTWQYAPGEWPANGYAGVLRLAETHVTSEICAHELVHAAVAILRSYGTANLGRTVGLREELLAYIYGDLFADFDRQL